MERAAIAVEALPPRAPSDRVNGISVGRYAEGKMSRTIAARVILYEAAADGTAGLKLGPCRIDLYPRPVLVKL